MTKIDEQAQSHRGRDTVFDQRAPDANAVICPVGILQKAIFDTLRSTGYLSDVEVAAIADAILVEIQNASDDFARSSVIQEEASQAAERKALGELLGATSAINVRALLDNLPPVKAFAETLPTSAFIADAEGNVLYHNRFFYDYVGTSLDQTAGWRWQDQPIIHPDDLDRTIRLWKEAICTGTPFEAEQRIRRYDGQYRWHLTRAIPQRSEQGQIEKWYGTDTDIHRQKLMQQELEDAVREGLAARQRIEESEQSLRVLADAMPQIVWMTDPQGRIVFHNKQWTTYTGLPNEKSFGYQRRHVIHPKDRSRWARAWYHSLKTGKPYDVEFRIRRADGSYRWFLSRAMPVKDGKGMITKWIGTNTDIEDQKRFAEEMQLAKAQAEAASATKSSFLANMSHEIRTPMTAILGFTELLRDPTFGEAERKDAISRISSSGYALLRLIDDLLNISKIEAGKLEIHKVHFSPIEVASEVVELMRLAADQKGIALTLDVSADVPMIAFSDPARLRQILTNLVGNAIKFTSRGGVTVRVSSDRSQLLAFEVADTGIGISKEDQAKLFHPFAQADGSITRTFGGTGLGLALSRNLAQNLGGSLELAESQSGKGSRFTLQIDGAPFRFDNIISPASSELERGSQGALNKNSLKGVRILMAEDVVDNQILMRRYLESAGATVRFAGDGQEAVQMALKGDFDLVLMDIQMPILDGIQATKKLRSKGYDRPILALTAHAMEEEAAHSIEAGCDAHLTKPISKSALVQAISGFSHPS